MFVSKGYEYRIEVERFAPVCKMWCEAGFRTTRDAVRLHLRALRLQQKRGDVRNIRVHKLC